jgi:DNA-binding LacI/PurR family transcriptional regulator
MKIRKYERVIAHIKSKYIGNPEFKDGRLPSEPELAEELGISRFPVNQAYNMLVESGDLTKISGLGTFIRGSEPKNYFSGRSARLTAGVICETGGFSAEIQSGLSEALSGTGILLTNLVYDRAWSSDDILSRVAELGLSALIVVPKVFFGGMDTEAVKMLNIAAGKGVFPLVIERPLEGCNCSRILVDNAGGTAMAAEWMISNGRNDLAYIGKDDYIVGKERFNGYMNALRNHGLEPDPGMIFLERGGSAFGKNIDAFVTGAMDSLLRRVPGCKSYITFNAETAYRVYLWLKKRGLLTKDVKIAGYDNLPYFNEEFRDCFICLRRPLFEIGKEAGLLLGKALKDGEPRTVIKRVAPEMSFFPENATRGML